MTSVCTSIPIAVEDSLIDRLAIFYRCNDGCPGHPAAGNSIGRGGHRKGNLFTGRIPESHLKLSINGQKLHLIRDICKKENRYIPIGHVGKVRIEASADAEIPIEEIQLPPDQELPVR